MDYAALKTEIEDDPEELGYAEHVTNGSDHLVAALLNEPRDTAENHLQLDVLQNWALTSGKILGVRAAAASNTPLKQPAELILAVLDSRLQAINLNNPQVQMVLGAMLQGEVLTESDIAELTALAAPWRQSRAQTLWGTETGVSAEDVAIALRGTEGGN